MAEPPSTVFAKGTLADHRHDRSAIRVAPLLVDSAALDAAGVFTRLSTHSDGLSSEDAAIRLAEHGPNVLAKDLPPALLRLLGRAVMNPLVILLAVLATISFATKDASAGTLMTLMIALSVGLKLIQESKASRAATSLKAMISVSATAMRDGAAQEVPIARLVPGDVVHLAAGDMIPADVRIVQAKDLFVLQGPLTGESLPVEKYDVEKRPDPTAPLELTSIAFLGTSVASGSATAAVVATGKDTYLAGMARSLSGPPRKTPFDRGISRFTWLLLRFMLVMVPLVFVINGLSKGSWIDAFFFALAVAVGLTPEMLPMIVTVCLSKGAVAMGSRTWARWTCSAPTRPGP